MPSSLPPDVAITHVYSTGQRIIYILCPLYSNRQVCNLSYVQQYYTIDKLHTYIMLAL